MKKGSERFSGLEKFFDVLGEIVALLLMVVFILRLTNAQFNYIPADSTFAVVLNAIFVYGFTVLLLVVGFEARVKRNFI
ncbi:MAG: hypothetical protein LBS99_06740, partial [Clostridiales bacterium]|nr:hypothetical protein [Clostridiales bacterium]